MLLCGFQSPVFPVYDRACETLWVRASLMRSVEALLRLSSFLQGEEEDVCVWAKRGGK